MLKSRQSRFVSVTRPNAPKVNRRPISHLVISAPLLGWEREVYSADPLGGDVSPY